MPDSLPAVQDITDSALRERISALSRDYAPDTVASTPLPQDLAAMERAMAEEQFQLALRRRIWWRLTPRECDAIRATVLARSPRTPRTWGLDSHCFEEIRRLLEDADARKGE